jgi:hypothetical protein
MFSSHINIIPIPSLIKFLSSNELFQLSLGNKSLQSDTKSYLQIRKKIESDSIIKYFLTDNNTITIRTKYDIDYEPNVRKIFHLLPELFNFIQLNDIKSLDLSCVTSYGGYPEDPFRLISRDKNILLDIYYQIVKLLKENQTLHYCNIGLIEWIVDKNYLKNQMQNHPSITCISIRSNGASQNFKEDPIRLYRKITGEFIWRHFMPKE